MARTAMRDYSPIPPDPERLDHLLNGFADTCGIQPAEVKVYVSYRFDDGGTDIRSVEPSALSALVPAALPISMITLTNKLSPPLLYIHIHRDHVGLEAEADTMSLAKNVVEGAVTCLGLTPSTTIRIPT